MDLERITDAQVTVDLAEPPGQPVRVGARAPHLLNAGLVGPAQQQRSPRASVDRGVAELSVGGVDLVYEVEHNCSFGLG